MPEARPRFDLSRLFLVGPLAIAVAVLAVLAVRVVAFAVLALPVAFPPLGWGPLVLFTAFFVTVAVLVFAVVARRAADPAGTYRRVALVALIASLVPDLLLPLDGTSGATWPAVIVLMVMHVAAWWPTVRILTTLGLSPSR
ncbi:MAG: DUF6069 family protein [Vicinamibacterales bacterium]